MVIIVCVIALRVAIIGRELPDFTWEKTDKASLLRKAL